MDLSTPSRLHESPADHAIWIKAGDADFIALVSTEKLDSPGFNSHEKPDVPLRSVFPLQHDDATREEVLSLDPPGEPGPSSLGIGSGESGLSDAVIDERRTPG